MNSFLEEDYSENQFLALHLKALTLYLLCNLLKDQIPSEKEKREKDFWFLFLINVKR